MFTIQSGFITKNMQSRSIFYVAKDPEKGNKKSIKRGNKKTIKKSFKKM